MAPVPGLSVDEPAWQTIIAGIASPQERLFDKFGASALNSFDDFLIRQFGGGEQLSRARDSGDGLPSLMAGARPPGRWWRPLLNWAPCRAKPRPLGITAISPYIARHGRLEYGDSSLTAVGGMDCEDTDCCARLLPVGCRAHDPLCWNIQSRHMKTKPGNPINNCHCPALSPPWGGQRPRILTL